MRQLLSQDDDALVDADAIEQLSALLREAGTDWDRQGVGPRGTLVTAWGPDEKLTMLCWLACAVGDGT